MKSVVVREISASKVNEKVVEVLVEATNQFTGEIYEAKGYARCSSKDKFIYEKGKAIAGMRAVRKVLQNMKRDYKIFIAKPYIPNPTESYYRKCINELLAIHDDLQFVNETLKLIEI
jgi:hypothetical protein